MRLQAGGIAPDFTIKTLRGKEMTLSEHASKRVWLAFFRFAACPLCNLRVHEIIENWSRFAGKVELFAFFQSPAARLEEFVAKQNPPFPLIADPEMRLYATYGVEKGLGAGLSASVMARTLAAKRKGFKVLTPIEGPAFGIPADFLVDRGGAIHTAFYGRTLSDHIPFELVDAFLGQTAGAGAAVAGL